jgi:hypothetical protein
MFNFLKSKRLLIFKEIIDFLIQFPIVNFQLNIIRGDVIYIQVFNNTLEVEGVIKPKSQKSFRIVFFFNEKMKNPDQCLLRLKKSDYYSSLISIPFKKENDRFCLDIGYKKGELNKLIEKMTNEIYLFNLKENTGIEFLVFDDLGNFTIVSTNKELDTVIKQIGTNLD